LWVLEDDGRAVGTLGLHRGPVPGVRSTGMAILASHRGRGQGAAMVETALALAWAEGAHKVELEVFPGNARAIALYARCGFLVEGLRGRHYPRRDGTFADVLLMAAHRPDPA